MNLLKMNCERIVCREWPEWAQELAADYKKAAPDMSGLVDGALAFYLKYIKENERKIVRQMIREAKTKKEDVQLCALHPDRFFEGFFALGVTVVGKMVKCVA